MRIKVPCFFRICSGQTENECLTKGVFGGYPFEESNLASIEKGHIGFLYNASQRTLIGVFEAEGKAGKDLVPGAFGNGFPMQVKIRPITKSLVRKASVYESLSAIVTMRPSRKGNFHYFEHPVHGPDVTEKVLALLFGSLDAMPPELKEFLKLSAEAVSEPGKIIENDGFDLDQVAGLDMVKNFIRSRIIAPFKDPERAHRFKLRVGGGMLLYGPPGTGKTLIATAISSEIKAKFYEITPSFILGYPGEAEKNLERLFDEMKRQPRAVLFMDEAEWILKTRDGQSSSVMERITPVLLAQLSDLFKDRARQIIIIAATNEPQKIDKAFLRPGRFDKKFYIGLPNHADRVKILKINLNGIEHRLDDKMLDELSVSLEGYSGADIAHIVEEASYEAYLRNDIERDFLAMEDVMKVIGRTARSVTGETNS